MNFSHFSQYLFRLEKISSRIEITKVLSELFKELKPKETRKAVYLLLGGLAPKYKSVVFNIADKMMIRSIAKAYNTKPEIVLEKYKTKGDLGDVAKDLSLQKGVKKNGLDILQVYDKLFKIADDSGDKSQERKVENSAQLLSSLDPESTKFIVRIMLGKLRLGFSDSTILDAISWMVSGDKSYKKDLENAYFVLPDVGSLLKRVKDLGVKRATTDISPVIGVPILPVLAQRIKTPSEMIEKMGRVAVEPKLDGLRLSLHIDKKNKSVNAFTRNLNENSWMFPELDEIGKYIKGDKVILDTEAVGLSEETKKMANFQATMTRRRKHNIESTSKKTKITFYVFDILSIDGKDLLNKPLEERRKILEKTVSSGSLTKVVESTQTNDPKLIGNLFNKYSKQGFEGILVKKLDSAYVPGRTGWRWVKMKQAAKDNSKLVDTIDCIVMGYSVGKGKRADFGVGKFLVGVRQGDKFKTTTKVGTGLTDELFINLEKRLAKLRVDKKPKEYEVEKNHTPDYWVKPQLVVEIAADEITKSPSHSSGLGLRFPRLVRFRDDKTPGETTTKKELQEIFRVQ